MNYKLITIAAISALAFTASASAFAATATCSKMTADKFKPQADLIAMLKSQGVTVSKVKTEGGCYEVYAKDASGKKLNTAFNAETLEPVASPEAGEN
ncbi:PepSY domain-containing protein [Aestuariivirga litoralis]|uniref:PepSY domain-containing protein n=1 Tax=Aestuariivirga litoralis TaxID=2650924 RepID=UPI0018C51867|nr:PepSY domain-containing protein [Aestuariivirga litoralis]MBG1230746.1 PepSY domain-containing protein [Aestuariivirga litoralis]